MKLNKNAVLALYRSCVFGLRPFTDECDHPLVGKGVRVDFSGPEGTTLHGVFYRHPSSRLLCVYSMGRQSNLSRGAENAGVMLAAGASALVFEYRGFGATPGTPSLPGMCQDTIAAVEYATGVLGYNQREIVLYGQSMGGIIASQVCSQRDIAGLVLQSTPLSLEAVAKHFVPPMRIWPSRLFPDECKSNTAEILGAINDMPPILVIHGRKDNIVPLSHSVKNFHAASGTRFLVHLPNGGHGALAVTDPDLYLASLTDFFAVVKSESA